MRKTWVLFVAGLALAACQRGCGRNKDSGHVAEPGAGQAPRVTFVIDKVYEQQQPTSSAPWHGAGGNWTFFDAHTDAGARFGFGFTHKPGKESRRSRKRRPHQPPVRPNVYLGSFHPKQAPGRRAHRRALTALAPTL
jgi:hypothetical protein